MKRHALHVVSPLTRLFPPLPPGEYDGLKESITRWGLLDEITLWRGMIIDGFHRLWACLKLRVEPRFHWLGDSADTFEFAVARNVHRRHLNATARAAAAFQASEMSRPGRPGGRGKHANSHVFPNRAQAARMFGVSPRSVATAAKVLGKESAASPGLRRSVREGTVTGNDALRILGEPPEVRERSLEMVRRGQIRTLRRAVNAAHGAGAGLPESGGAATAASDNPGRYALHVAAVSDLHRLVPGNTVDAVVTYPPSDPAHAHLLPALADFAAHALRASGAMFVLADSRRLPDVLAKLEHSDLPWVCALPYRHPGRGGPLGGRHRLTLRSKLLLIYGKTQFSLENGDDAVSVPDFEEGTGGNPLSPRLDPGMEMIIRRFTRPGQMVCDPILLDRTDTAMAAVGQGRDFTGAWSDQAAVDRVRERMARALPAPEVEVGRGRQQ